jgi:hypothetical protein
LHLSWMMARPVGSNDSRELNCSIIELFYELHKNYIYHVLEFLLIIGIDLFEVGEFVWWNLYEINFIALFFLGFTLLLHLIKSLLSRYKPLLIHHSVKFLSISHNESIKLALLLSYLALIFFTHNLLRQSTFDLRYIVLIFIILNNSIHMLDGLRHGLISRLWLLRNTRISNNWILRILANNLLR